MNRPINSNKPKYSKYQISHFPCPVCGSFISGSLADDEFHCLSCGMTIKVDHDKTVSQDILDKLKIEK